MTDAKESISRLIWDMKYRHRDRGKVLDVAIEDTWQRVAKAVAAAEKPPERAAWEHKFYQILENYQFLPGGRILAGAGTQHQVTLLNCFVMDIPEDSLQGVFTALSEGELTLREGGGVGYDFSILRPQGETIHQKNLQAAGPVSLMRLWDTMSASLLAKGGRRGAMMGVLRCDHPDIEAFIAAKSDPQELRHFNVSVMVSDAFIKAMQDNQDWALVFPDENAPEKEACYRRWGHSLELVRCRIYRYVNARELWKKIIQAAYDYAEPGVLFSDTINRLNPLWYREHIAATNPCGEIPLQPYGACDLGSINLTKFVLNPFEKNADLNWRAIEKTVQVATRFLDNVLDVSQYPLIAQREQAIGTRRIGLGITGLANAFIMLGITYGSAKSIKLAQELMRYIADGTWQTSIELAEEKGNFPFYKKEYLEGAFVKTLDVSLQAQIEKRGIRNSHHNAIAPTGTISLLAENISNGIEPVFKARYERHIRNEKGVLTTYQVEDFTYKEWKNRNEKEKLPPAWVDTDNLEPIDHLQIQAAMQPYIDNSISKTINIPVDFPFEKLMDVYTKAYELGLKGCTVFRPNPVTGSVLEAKPEEIPPIEQCCQGG
jgi:ribonucleoside-diphosphate reductase alpha chain